MSRLRSNRLNWVLFTGLLLPVVTPAQHSLEQTARRAQTVARGRVTDVRSGTFAAQPGGWLRLRTDLGRVRVTPHDLAEVRYRVVLEAEAANSEAEPLKLFQVTGYPSADGVQILGTVPWRDFRGRVWASFEVSVPRQFNLEVTTQAGDVEIGDLAGEVRISTSGGNITVGDIVGSARLETLGGHVTVNRVSGDISAVTGGGHVHVQSAGGAAVLRSAGGHIFAGHVGGQAEVDTGGGNITLGRTEGNVTAATGGGQIDFGEVSGAVTARTGGGGIRILEVRGPIQVETSGGSIHLMQVGGPVRASTAAGDITAFFQSEQKLRTASELLCRQGDIVVYLPRNLPLTIDATIEGATDHNVIAPGLPLNLQYSSAGGHRRSLRATAELNGGGQPLRLRTVSGNIRLQFADTLTQLEDRRRHIQTEQLQRQLQMQHQELRRQMEQMPRAIQRQHQPHELEVHWIDSLPQRLLFRFRGYVRVAPKEQMKKLVYSVRPVYPESARLARVQGTVRMDVLIGRDGRVEDVKVLEGPSVLIEAAREAVRQWRYSPTMIGNELVPVLTTVNVEFRLN